jgi:hypothetical protein
LEISYTKDEIKSIILQIVTKEKPENVEKLKQLMLQKSKITFESTTQLLIELEKEDKLHFTKLETQKPSSIRNYIFSQKVIWYWAIIVLSTSTAISIFAIPEGTYILEYVRIVLSIIFLLFLPGYAIIKALFPLTVPLKTATENLNNIERIALSIGASSAFIPIVGLILDYTPSGIHLAPLCLLSLTIVSATIAVLREYFTNNKL